MKWQVEQTEEDSQEFEIVKILFTLSQHYNFWFKVK